MRRLGREHPLGSRMMVMWKRVQSKLRTPRPANEQPRNQSLESHQLLGLVTRPRPSRIRIEGNGEAEYSTVPAATGEDENAGVVV